MKIKKKKGIFFLHNFCAFLGIFNSMKKLPSFWTEALAVPHILHQKQEVIKTHFLYQAPQLLKIHYQ